MKRVAFCVASFLLVVVTIESASLVTGRLLYGPAFFESALARMERRSGAEGRPWQPPGSPQFLIRGRVEVLHPYTGYGLGGQEVAARVRGLGFRKAPQALRAERTRGVMVVAVLGGSVAENLGAPGPGSHWLARRLRAAAPAPDRVWVVDLALAGYKQPQQLMTVAYFLANGARFDVVVNLDGFNDVVLPLVENAPAGTPLDYPRSWRARTAGLDQETRERVAEWHGLGLTQSRLAALADAWPASSSFTAMLLWRRCDDVLGRRRAQAQVAILAGGGGDAGAHAATADDLAAAVALWRRSSIQLHRLCEGNGVRYFHFLQPNIHAGGKPFSPEERALIGKGRHPYRKVAQEGYPLLAAEAGRLRAAGVRFIDLTGLFQDVAETIYVDSCCHVNGRGNELMAEAIAGTILADTRGPRHPDASGDTGLP